ncbi:MAG: PD-(D/E)XK nuclease family protein [Cyclobacteriaceae bacterium]|nr:PD-(D/E)XK nuclease family protein [Cyclobacteriaceae bacterium]
MEWSISKLSTLRQCHRKFYFSYELADFHFTHAVRRKAFELGQSKNLRMWQGTLIDNFFSKRIIPLYKERKAPDYPALADELVEIAKRQFSFSEQRLYRDKTMTKTKAGDTYQILDIHECGVPYKEEDVLAIYTRIREIILQIPEYGSPDPGKTLHQYLLSSSYLQPDIRYWSYEFEGITLNPQIDLVRRNGKSIHVIDWKVSDSTTSDYSKQLYLAGIVAFHNIKKSNREKGFPDPKLEEISLFEINLMNGNRKQHELTRESSAGALDYVYQFRDEQEQLSQNKKWDELRIEDYQTTDKKETCMFCKFKPLCIHLINNNFKYDENEYYKLVSSRQLAGI